MLKVEDIYKNYRKQAVLNGVSLEIDKGTIQALLGANGAGKTTLVNVMACIITKDAGNIWLNHELLNEKNEDYRRQVGYVFDQSIFIEKFTAKEYLRFVAGLYELPKDVYQARINDLLAFFELTNEQDKAIEKYSKGMRSKVALAAALIHQPSYLIMDEPFDGMDFVAVQKVSRLLKDMAQKGTTILVTSHQYDVISELCDKFALLKGGKVLFNEDFDMLSNMAREADTPEGNVKAYLEGLMVSDSHDDEKLSWLR